MNNEDKIQKSIKNIENQAIIKKKRKKAYRKTKAK